MGQSPVRTISMDPVAFVFGFLKRTGAHDAAPAAVRFKRTRQGLGRREAHGSLQHLDDVFKRVIVIIENDEMIESFQLS